MKNQDSGFNSFFMGGFECADHINRSGVRINLLHETEHHLRAFNDYELLYSLEIKVVREGVCWSTVEKSPYVFDFSSLKDRMDAAAALGIQIIWDLCHFGYPVDMVPTHPLFPSRFMAFCRAFTLFHNQYSAEKLYVVPINEISFLSWHSGDMRGTVPFAINSGFDIKYHLCKAAIAGIEVIKQTDPEAVVILVEPLVKVHAGDTEITEERLKELNEIQYQAMDMITGTMCPELGGSPALYDMVGFNYYYNNQWDHFNEILPWHDSERRTTPLSKLLLEGYNRYGKPVLLSETGHFKEDRPRWMEEVTLECDRAISMGVDLRGICIYPVIDRPDWDNLNYYCNCGLWDMDENKNRIPYEPVIQSVKKCIQLMETRIPVDGHGVVSS
jgi:beta-glucosidase/6-phospho-beta-glucosidase/beta-galactosidase